jgi:hypothetical protein
LSFHCRSIGGEPGAKYQEHGSKYLETAWEVWEVALCLQSPAELTKSGEAGGRFQGSFVAGLGFWIGASSTNTYTRRLTCGGWWGRLATARHPRASTTSLFHPPATQDEANAACGNKHQIFGETTARIDQEPIRPTDIGGKAKCIVARSTVLCCRSPDCSRLDDAPRRRPGQHSQLGDPIRMDFFSSLYFSISFFFKIK